MKKVSPWWVIIAFCVGIFGTIITIFWYKIFPKGTDLDLAALVTFIGVICGLIGVMWSTNKQIRNQNKESFRPYITIKSANKKKDNFIGDTETVEQRLDESDFHYGHIVTTALSIKKRDEVGYNYIRKIVKFELCLKNIGYGIACNLDFIPANDTALYYQCRNGDESGDTFSTVDIETYGEKTFDFNLNIEFKTDEKGKIVAFATDVAHLLVFYTDLYGNVYSTMLILVVNKHGVLSYTCYPEGTEKFKSMMKKISGNYKESIDKYAEKQNSEERNNA